MLARAAPCRFLDQPAEYLGPEQPVERRAQAGKQIGPHQVERGHGEERERDGEREHHERLVAAAREHAIEHLQHEIGGASSSKLIARLKSPANTRYGRSPATNFPTGALFQKRTAAAIGVAVQARAGRAMSPDRDSSDGLSTPRRRNSILARGL